MKGLLRSLRTRKVLVVAALALVIALVLVTALTHQGRVAVKTALLLPQLFPNAPVHPQEWFAPQPLREEVSYSVDGGQRVADLYRPRSGGKHGAVLLFMGIVAEGRDDPRVVGLSNGLARAGVVVMVVPGSETTIACRIDPEEPESLVAAFQYLRSQEFVDPRRVGMGGFCVGASVTMVAAADPRISDEVAFINSFGGYYDGRDLVKSIASQTRFYGKRQEPWKSDPFSREVLINQLIDSLARLEERVLLRRVFVEGQQAAPGEIEALSPQGRAAYHFLDGPTLAEADALIARLPLAFQESLRAVSPSEVIEHLQARVLLMHDREDTWVPSEESRRLADALEGRGDIYYTEFSFFQHVDPTHRVSLPTFVREVTKLFLHMYNILLLVA